MFLVIRDFERFLQRGMVKTCASNKTIHSIKLSYILELDTGRMTSLPKQNQRIIMIKTYKKGKNQIQRPALVLRLPLLEKLDVETM